MNLFTLFLDFQDCHHLNLGQLMHPHIPKISYLIFINNVLNYLHLRY